MEDGLLSLKWNNHKITFTKEINLYRYKALYSDVTLACEGQYFHVHKIILSSCSEYFQEIFTNTECKQPVIILKDIKASDVEYILQYVYLGEVEVRQSQLSELIKTAECLKIKGLACPDDIQQKEEASRKKKRKRHTSGEKPHSPKWININQSDTLSDKNNTSSQRSYQLEEPKDIIKLEPDDVGMRGELNTMPKYDKSYDDNSCSSVPKYNNYEENSSSENQQQIEDLALIEPNLPVEYATECEAGPSGINEDSMMDNSSTFEDSSQGHDSDFWTGQEFFEASGQDEQSHKERSPFQCAMCVYSTKSKAHIERHMSVHTGEKPFMCQYCGHQAARKEHLDVHMKTHTGEKPYLCPHCPYRSIHKHNIRSHQLTNHYFL